MKNYTQSGGINLSALSTNIAYAILAGTGIGVSSSNTSSGGITTVTYTVSLAADVSDLDDVNLTSLQDLDILQYDSGTSKWVNIAHTLDNLTNVNITTPANGSLLKYDTGTSKWIDGFTSVDKLSDVTIANIAENNILKWNGNVWENTQLTITELTDVSISNLTLAAGDILYYDGNDWINTPLSAIIGGILTINTTPTSNSSSAQTYLQTYDLSSTLATNGNLFEILDIYLNGLSVENIESSNLNLNLLKSTGSIVDTFILLN